MALVIGSTALLGSLWLVSKSSRWETKHKEEVPERTTIQNRRHHTGTYKSIEALSQIAGGNLQGLIVKERFSQDLSGAPVRWLEDRNGTMYKTYDLQTRFIY